MNGVFADLPMLRATSPPFRLYLDDVGTEVGQGLGAVGAKDHGGHVGNAYATKDLGRHVGQNIDKWLQGGMGLRLVRARAL